MIDFSCRMCGELLSVPECLAGQTETCPICKKVVYIPQKKLHLSNHKTTAAPIISQAEIEDTPSQSKETESINNSGDQSGQMDSKSAYNRFVEKHPFFAIPDYFSDIGRCVLGATILLFVISIPVISLWLYFTIRDYHRIKNSFIINVGTFLVVTSESAVLTHDSKDEVLEGDVISDLKKGALLKVRNTHPFYRGMRYRVEYYMSPGEQRFCGEIGIEHIGLWRPSSYWNYLWDSEPGKKHLKELGIGIVVWPFLIILYFLFASFSDKFTQDNSDGGGGIYSERDWMTHRDRVARASGKEPPFTGKGKNPIY